MIAIKDQLKVELRSSSIMSFSQRMLKFDSRLIGLRIRNRRRELGWSQSDLAEQSLLGLSTICNHEQGQKQSVHVYLAICVALGIDLDYLITPQPQEMVIPDGICQAIKQRRKELGFSSREVCRRSGVNVASYSMLENNKRRPTYEQIKSICLALMMTPSQLAGQLPAS